MEGEGRLFPCSVIISSSSLFPLIFPLKPPPYPALSFRCIIYFPSTKAPGARSSRFPLFLLCPLFLLSPCIVVFLFYLSFSPLLLVTLLTVPLSVFRFISTSPGVPAWQIERSHRPILVTLPPAPPLPFFHSRFRSTPPSNKQEEEKERRGETTQREKQLKEGRAR